MVLLAVHILVMVAVMVVVVVQELTDIQAFHQWLVAAAVPVATQVMGVMVALLLNIHLAVAPLVRLALVVLAAVVVVAITKVLQDTMAVAVAAVE
jgi:hypothetical protein